MILMIMGISIGVILIVFFLVHIDPNLSMRRSRRDLRQFYEIKRLIDMGLYETAVIRQCKYRKNTFLINKVWR